MLITPNRINELKAEVKAECNRRAYAGNNMSQYGSTDYDYESVPTKGRIIANEHYNKVATPLNIINSDIVTKKSVNNNLVKDSDLIVLETFVTTLEKRNVDDLTAGDCKTSCTGMCYGCQTTCTGCTGCTNKCSGCTGCTNKCTGCTSCSSCTGCSGGCSGCGGDCTAICGFGCGSGCASGCFTAG